MRTALASPSSLPEFEDSSPPDFLTIPSEAVASPTPGADSAPKYTFSQEGQSNSKDPEEESTLESVLTDYGKPCHNDVVHTEMGQANVIYYCRADGGFVSNVLVFVHDKLADIRTMSGGHANSPEADFTILRAEKESAFVNVAVEHVEDPGSGNEKRLEAIASKPYTVPSQAEPPDETADTSTAPDVTGSGDNPSEVIQGKILNYDPDPMHGSEMSLRGFEFTQCYAKLASNDDYLEWHVELTNDTQFDVRFTAKMLYGNAYETSSIDVDTMEIQRAHTVASFGNTIRLEIPHPDRIRCQLLGPPSVVRE